MLITKKGLAVRFNESKLRTMGRTATGVRGINLAEDDEVISMIITSEGKYLLFDTENGMGKRTDQSEFDAKGRGGKGKICYKANEKTGKLVGAKIVNDDDEIMIINTDGIIIRMSVNDISVIGRAGIGVRLMSKSGEEKIAAITKVLDSE